MKNIIIFASGSGTNAENIIRFFQSFDNIKITYVVSNRPDAMALKRAEKLNVGTKIFSKDDFYGNNRAFNFLLREQPDMIVLAGFLLLVPADIIKAFPRRIINIHPALLPKFGGKGMYGGNVHHAVIEQKETESGITIHYVNEKYDDGDIIFQAACPVLPNDTCETLAARIHELEYVHFPKVIQGIVENIIV
ncbi:MAG: phosphoribosylglycinamide formyltransferase [Cytophagaceae bacterium]|nr:phosphoribosylglycinamide formyltransferase [Cytophagaceae bacterium]